MNQIKNKPNRICCICGEPLGKYGHNPYPIKEEGECCDKCNLTKVLPARLLHTTGTEDR